MAPRIRNISSDEFRRLFQSPETAKVGPSLPEAISLSNAIEERRRNEVAQQQKLAEIERKIAEEEQKRQQVNRFAELRGQQAAAPLEAAAQANIDPTQPGIEQGPLPQGDVQAINEAKELASLEAQLAPSATIQEGINLRSAQAGAERDRLASERDFAQRKELENIKFENQKELKELEQSFKKASARAKLPQIVLRQTEKANSVDRMINEISRFVDTLEAEGLTDLSGAAKIKFAEASRGFSKDIPIIGKFLDINPEVVSFEQARDSLGRRLYKDISGDVGNIAQQEGKFAKNLIPTGKETPGLRTAKVERLQRIQTEIRQGTQQIQQMVEAGRITPEQGEALYKEIVTDTIDKAISELPAAEQEQPREEIPGFDQLSPAEQQELLDLRRELEE